jgi:ATP-dependent RNA helicase RhlE
MDSRKNPGHLRGGHELKKSPKSEPTGFGVFGLQPALLRAVEKLGWTLPSPVQHDAIPIALAGQDLIGIAQTGTGKTGAFVLPLLDAISQLPPAKPLRPYCVIVVPTRELAQQIDSQIVALGDGLRVRSAKIFGGVSERPQIGQLSAGVEIITATPGRLLDLLGQGYVNFEHVTHCVLDEADRMFDMGFIISLRRILRYLPARRQTLLFSATMPPEVRSLALEFQTKPREVRIGVTAPPPELSHEAWELEATQKPAALDLLLREDYDCVLVFTRTKHRADSVARRLARDGESVAVLHSNRSQNQRDLALARFKQGDARVLVATDVASRGLDIAGIGLVVNYDAPMVPDDYVHRVGRTARAKRQGHAVSLVAQDELKYIGRVEQLLKLRIARREQELPVREANAAVEEATYFTDRDLGRRPPAQNRGQRRDATPRQRDARPEPRAETRPGARTGASEPAPASRRNETPSPRAGAGPVPGPSSRNRTRRSGPRSGR